MSSQNRFLKRVPGDPTDPEAATSPEDGNDPEVDEVVESVDNADPIENDPIRVAAAGRLQQDAGPADLDAIQL
jgi:hypothetical protein